MLAATAEPLERMLVGQQQGVARPDLAAAPKRRAVPQKWWHKVVAARSRLARLARPERPKPLAQRVCPAQRVQPKQPVRLAPRVRPKWPARLEQAAAVRLEAQVVLLVLAADK